MNQTLLSTEDTDLSGIKYSIDELKRLAKEEKGRTKKLHFNKDNIRVEIGEVSNVYYRQGQLIGDVKYFK